MDTRMSDILITYDERKDKFESYALTLKSLLTTLIRNEKISIHSLESRVKTKKSLEGKINKKGKYKSIDDITEIVGIRIITHYADDVDKIAAIVEKEFTIDQENSIDKRTSIAPDKFGYLSLHYIVTLNSTRTNLKEYEVYKNIKAELQIRSILQHAWAEIEHDIGYKSATGLPNEIRRYFSRLAGLLEMADDEFIKIRKKISERQKEVAKELEQGTSDSVLDIFTLDEFLNTSRIMSELSEEIKEKTGITVHGRYKDKDLGYLLNGLNLANITTIEQLNQKLSQMKKQIVERIFCFGEPFINYCRETPMPKEALLSYLCQIIVALQNSPSLESEFNNKAGLNLKNSNISDFFSNIRENISTQP